MSLVEFIINDGGFPASACGWIAGREVGGHINRLSLTSTIPSPMERENYEGIFFVADMNPPHPVGRRIVGKLDWFYLAQRSQIMDRSGLFFAVGVPWIPVSTDGYFHLAISVNVTRCDADIIPQLGALIPLMEGVE
jgi:hypothetical protein